MGLNGKEICVVGEVCWVEFRSGSIRFYFCVYVVFFSFVC